MYLLRAGSQYYLLTENKLLIPWFLAVSDTSIAPISRQLYIEA